jgi:hypothetical protein
MVTGPLAVPLLFAALARAMAPALLGLEPVAACPVELLGASVLVLVADSLLVALSLDVSFSLL